MTKRLLTIAFFLLSVCGTICAQVSIGLQTGADFPKISNLLQGYNGSGGTVSRNSQSLTRFYGGFLADIPLDKRQQFILRPSLLYLGAGGATPEITDFNGNALALPTKYYLEYVQLPIQFLYSPTLSFGKPWIGGGVYESALLSAIIRSSATSGDLNIGSAKNDDIKRFDFGYIASAGFTFKFGILLGVDFQQSLTTIVPNPSSGESTVRNSIWGVHVGYISSMGGGSRAGR